MELHFLKRISGLCVLAIWLTGCTERIGIDTHDAAPRLVIYGHLTSEPIIHTIKITRSTGYFAATAPEGISGARVTIAGGGQTFMLQENAGERGLYQTEPGVFGIPGTEYTLDVAVDMNGQGKVMHYRAVSVMPPSANLKEIALEPAERRPDYLSILISAILPEGGNHHYSLHVWRNEKMINDSLPQFRLFNDRDFTSNILLRVPCYYIDQQKEYTRISKGDRVTVALNVIPQEYFDFLNDASSETGGSIPFFSGPPANIATNIRPVDATNSTLLAGFFSTYTVSRRSEVYD